ncbi:unnamed protein product [Orchesella dallaii]|uniref:Uncharacterized protein n=1 Tax=Orchesella dallaii TaxID=48710 RepID=A0ABP1R784_9HEXA
MNLWTSAVLGAVILAVASAQFAPAGPPAEPAPEPAGPPAPQTCVPAPAATACACGSAQPITIQLSCGGGGNRRPASGARPPPPPQYSQPPQDYTTDASWHNWETTAVPSAFDGYNMDNFCNFDEQGYPDPFLSPPGGFPQGFRAYFDDHQNPIIETGPGVPRPPTNWDGNAATLGFPMPPIGTPEGNMLMCWPIPVPVMPAGK